GCRVTAAHERRGAGARYASSDIGLGGARAVGPHSSVHAGRNWKTRMSSRRFLKPAGALSLHRLAHALRLTWSQSNLGRRAPMTRAPMRLAVQRWDRSATGRRRGLLLAAFVLAFGVVLWEHLYHTLYLGYSDTVAGHATHVLRDAALAMPLAMAAIVGGLWLTRGLSRPAQALGVSLLLGLLLVPAAGVHDRIDSVLVTAGHQHEEGTGLLQLSHGVADAFIAMAVAPPLALFVVW